MLKIRCIIIAMVVIAMAVGIDAAPPRRRAVKRLFAPEKKPESPTRLLPPREVRRLSKPRPEVAENTDQSLPRIMTQQSLPMGPRLTPVQSSATTVSAPSQVPIAMPIAMPVAKQLRQLDEPDASIHSPDPIAPVAPIASGRSREIFAHQPTIGERLAATPTNDILSDFSPNPLLQTTSSDLAANLDVYAGKQPVPTQRPWVELGQPFYGTGITPKGTELFGPYHPLRGEGYLYGDLRTGIASGRNAAGRTDNFATRLNLDADLKLTDTERLHAFIGPLDDGGAFTRYEYEAGDLRFRNEIDFTPVTAFLEGDLGAIFGGATGQPSPKEIPFAIGLVPLIFQNGIWIEDAVTGIATAIPAQHSAALNWSNFDATFFAIFDQLNSPAFGNDENAAQAFGTNWFIEAYGGYIESGYAYVRDRNRRERSYHNITASFTRRYFDRISNSVRVIVNTGQDGPQSARTADGTLLLIENSYITADPLRFVPYFNLFVGWDRPQSVARAGISGGILRNTGLNFDTDGLNGFATLDPTGNNTAGFSVGVDLIGQELDHQWIVEATYLTRNNGPNPLVQGDQAAVGTRYQFPISHRTLIRTDLMYGWRGGLGDVYGTRMEWRWKF